MKQKFEPPDIGMRDALVEPDREPGQVSQQMAYLTDSIARLRENVNALAIRLKPIVDAKTEISEVVNEKVSLVPLAEEISNVLCRLYEVNNVIVSLNKGIQL